MKLFGWLIPWWAYAIAAGAVFGSGFGAGFQVESWRWSASELHAVKKQTKQARHQAARQHTESESYEQDRERGRQADLQRETQIRTIYRDRPVAAECAAPDAVRGVLDDAVQSANARARGEPGTAVSAAP